MLANIQICNKNLSIQNHGVGAGHMECLPSVCKAMDSTSNTITKKPTKQTNKQKTQQQQ
jgi:hypothetical protein